MSNVSVKSKVKVGNGDKVYEVAALSENGGVKLVDGEGKVRYVGAKDAGKLVVQVFVKGEGFTPHKKAMRFTRHNYPDAPLAERQDFAAAYVAYEAKQAGKGKEAVQPAAFYESGYGKQFS